MIVRISATDDFLYVGGSASGGNPAERQKIMAWSLEIPIPGKQNFLTSPARRGVTMFAQTTFVFRPQIPFSNFSSDTPRAAHFLSLQVFYLN